MSRAVFVAFKAIDTEGNGSHVRINQVQDVLDYMGYKLSFDDQQFLILELDSENTGYIEAQNFKEKLE